VHARRESWAGPVLASGPNGWPRPTKPKMDFHFCFKFPFSKHSPNSNLNNKNAFLEHDSKIKVVQNFMLYNFA
jgi:hypothetical protein